MEDRPVLVVDDEPKIREICRIYLEQNGFSVIEAGDGEKAVEMAASQRPCLIVLDLMLPGIDGWEVCRRVRQTSGVPIIMLTAKVTEVDRVVGLELGADDYVPKPFSPRELVARVKAVLRRSHGSRAEKEVKALTYGELTVDHDARRVVLQSEEIALTPKEFDLLWFMASSPGKVFSRETLLECVWKYEYLGDARTVDSHIKSLRDKLGAEERQRIRTVWGVGYKFAVDDRGGR